jgi:hypothetical protein
MSKKRKSDDLRLPFLTLIEKDNAPNYGYFNPSSMGFMFAEFYLDSDEARERHRAYKAALQAESDRCRKLGIPVPKLHGPEPRLTIGAALRIAMRRRDESQDWP